MNDAQTVLATTLFAHNTWANLKILAFCETLNDAQLDATAVGCYGSIRDTLLHILRAEVGYVARVNGRRPSLVVTPNEFPGFAALQDVARWTGDELLQLALSVQTGSVVREHQEGQISEYPLASLIMQAITHSTEHRSHIATIITQLGLEPPDLSGWEYMVQTGEFQEFPDTGQEA